MNDRQLQYALTLAKTLNFVKAAETLGISQPALSKQIAALENTLGATLFDRSRSPLTLTAAGTHFLREAAHLLYREEQLLRSMQEFSKGERGELVIGISPFRSQYLIPRVAAQLREHFPKVRLVLAEEGSDTLRREAAEGKYDLAVVNLPVDESVLDVHILEADTLVLAVPNSLLHRLPEEVQKQDTIRFCDCENLDFIALSPTQELRKLFESACSAENITPHITTEVVGIGTAYALCRAGVGAALLPLQFIRAAKNSDTVRIFSLARTFRSRQPVVVTRRGAYLSDAAREAIRLLCEGE